MSLDTLAIISSLAYNLPTFIASKGTVETWIGLLTFGNHSMDTVVPITEVTASFMYTFLVAAIILLTDIFSDIFLLTDLETIEPMDEPANKADISRSNGH